MKRRTRTLVDGVMQYIKELMCDVVVHNIRYIRKQHSDKRQMWKTSMIRTFSSIQCI